MGRAIIASLWVVWLWRHCGQGDHSVTVGSVVMASLWVGDYSVTVGGVIIASLWVE